MEMLGTVAPWHHGTLDGHVGHCGTTDGDEDGHVGHRGTADGHVWHYGAFDGDGDGHVEALWHVAYILCT